MKAIRIHRFDGIDALALEDVPLPVPGRNEVLVRVAAAGVGPWDAWIREGKSRIPQPLPLVLGSDLSGQVAQVGAGVTGLRPGDEVFGVTNSRFTGACAEFALAEAGMIARKPERLSHLEAASVPVVAVTAWKMVFDHGQVDGAKRVLVHGAAGNVGAYLVQLARTAGAARVIATAGTADLEYVRSLKADQVIDARPSRFEEEVKDVDVVLDTVGGEVLDRSFGVVKRGGVVVSSAAPPDPERAARAGVKGVFFIVDVTTEGLDKIAERLEDGRLTANVGEVLPLAEAQKAHEMLAGMPHRRGKIVLAVGAS